MVTWDEITSMFTPELIALAVLAIIYGFILYAAKCSFAEDIARRRPSWSSVLLAICLTSDPGVLIAVIIWAWWECTNKEG